MSAASASSGRVFSVSVDLDGLEHYYAIHGLAAGPGRELVYTVALPRFLALFDALGVRATFFAIGQSLEDEAAATMLARARNEGHEIGNHTYHHRYDLVRLPDDELLREIVSGDEAIRRATGHGCVGFRAPGYNVDERVLAVCRKLGYRYDSSVFPSYPYYLAKAGVMGALRAIGRPSQATLGHPKVLAAPVHPYVPDVNDWRRRAPRLDREGAPFIELPITLVPVLRFPFIGTWVCLWSESMFDIAFATVRRSTQFVNLELHGIELLGLVEDGLPPALRRQPDLRVPLAAKERKLRHAIASIASEFESMTLAQAAARLARPA